MTEEYIKKITDKKLLLRLSTEVIRYIIDQVDDCNQKKIASAVDVSPATINAMANGENKETTVSAKLIRKSLIAIITEYKVQYDSENKAIVGLGITDNRTQGHQEPSFFSTPYGNRWKIIVHINHFNKERQDIGIRYLHIKSRKKAEFIVGLARQDDYEGTFDLTMDGKQVIFDLVTRKGVKKEAYLRFCIGNPSAAPQIMEGFLLHSKSDDNSMSAYTVIAENISSKSNVISKARLISFDQFKKSNEIVADFFTLRNTAIHCHSGVYSYDELNDLNIRRKELIKRHEVKMANLNNE